VILEGSVRREKRTETLNQSRKDYSSEYHHTPGLVERGGIQIVFRVEPRIVHAWKAPRMHRSLVKFIL
jgi:hypothetical protein